MTDKKKLLHLDYYLKDIDLIEYQGKKHKVEDVKVILGFFFKNLEQFKQDVENNK